MIEVVVKLIGAWIATWGFAYLVKTPGKFRLYAAGVGTIGWAVYLITEMVSDGNMMKNFFAALTVAIVSRMMARFFKAPVTVFVIPGILPLVPGAGMYQIVYASVMGPSEMVGTYVIQTLQIAGVIALGIFLADTVQKVIPPKGFTKI
ncbi:MAG: threonine/serine exporter family protein [Fusicatenibacter sp.]|nr:threonine/serine exporter family protein [Lachnospiraceae bacterium]MDY2938990.1 threonine/serine exporter family protein [Fusicatenibacter sp.]